MLNKFKTFTIKMKGDIYSCLYDYYVDEAKGFIKLGKYDEAERCQELATKYLMKEHELIHKSLWTV